MTKLQKKSTCHFLRRHKWRRWWNSHTHVGYNRRVSIAATTKVSSMLHKNVKNYWKVSKIFKNFKKISKNFKNITALWRMSRFCHSSKLKNFLHWQQWLYNYWKIVCEIQKTWKIWINSHEIHLFYVYNTQQQTKLLVTLDDWMNDNRSSSTSKIFRNVVVEVAFNGPHMTSVTWHHLSRQTTFSAALNFN